MALFAGASGLVGWLADLEFLGHPAAWHAPMSFVTALLLCIGSCSLAVQSLPVSRGRRWVLRILGLTLLVMGGWTLVAYITGGRLPSDVWLLDRRIAQGLPSHTNRMSPASAMCFLLFGLVSLLRALLPRKGGRVVQVLSALGFLLSLVSLVGYLYSVALLVALKDYKPIAPQTAASFFLLFVGTYLADPRHGIMRIVLSDETGGFLARRLLLFVFFIPVLLGAIASAGLRGGLFTPAVCIFFLTAATVACLASLLLFNAFAIDTAERERRQALKSLEESERAYRSLFQNAADPMFLVDRDLAVLTTNAAAVASLEVPAAELQGRRLPDLTAVCEAETHRGLTQAFEDGFASFEACARTSGGCDVPLEIHARAVEFHGAAAVLAVARDLSERRRAERELAEKEGLLRQAQKMEAIGRLAGGVAHDFNNLLTVIMGYAELLLARPGLTEEARGEASEIKTCAERAATLTRQLLAFSRKQPASPRTTDANRVIEKLAPLLRRLIGENIRLDIRLPAAPRLIFIDPNQLEQVFLNLAANARDAMPGGGTLTIESLERLIGNDPLAFTPTPSGGMYVEFSVRDTGCGIPPEITNHIFEPFFTTKPETKGTGLGLSTVYGIVTQNGGAIRVDTSPDTGTVMRVLFPVSSSMVEDTGHEEAAEAARARHSATLLLVEDDPEVREYLRTGLLRAGYNVLTAGSGEEALSVVSLSPFAVDAVISDVVMPGLGGRELAAILERSIPGVRILFMSGYDQAGVPGIGTLCGRYDLITKPFTITELVDKLFENDAATSAWKQESLNESSQGGSSCSRT